MNRSFQAFAVLLVSLTGAMLAVNWTPPTASSPRHQPSRLRAAGAPWGQVVARSWPPVRACASSRIKTVNVQTLPSAAARTGMERGSDVPPAWRLPPLARNLADSCGPLAQRLAGAPALLRVRSAFQQVANLTAADRWLAPARADASAASGTPLVDLGGRLRGLSAWVGRATRETARLDTWRDRISIPDELIINSRKMAADFGIERMWRRAALQGKFQEEWLAMKETFRPLVERVPWQLPTKAPPAPTPPAKRRRMILAAAGALETVSQWLHQAAEQLKESSQPDVAELDTPVEKREEKR